MNIVHPVVEPQKPDVTGIADMFPLLNISYNEHNADDESNNLLNISGATDTSPINLKSMEFSLKPSAKMIRQSNYSAFNKCKMTWGSGFLEK